MKITHGILVTLLCVLITPSVSFAETAGSTFMRALEHADVIAETEVVDARSRWEGGLVVTTVSARVTRCIRGSCPSETIRYEVPGGEIDGVVQVVSGSLVPRIGHAMVLLLERHPTGMRLLSRTVGQLPITIGEDGAHRVQLPQRRVTTRELRHLALTAVRR